MTGRRMKKIIDPAGEPGPSVIVRRVVLKFHHQQQQQFARWRTNTGVELKFANIPAAQWLKGTLGLDAADCTFGKKKTGRGEKAP